MSCREKEVAFYTTIQAKYPEFAQWIAGYYGIKEINQDGICGRFMALDDLTIDYAKPSVIDLKIGTETWESDAPAEKIARESKKYPLQRKIGFRLTGMRVYNPTSGNYDIYDKSFGKKQTEESLQSMFSIFFEQIDLLHRKQVVSSILEQLKPILAWFEVPGRLRFICTSVLFIFDGAAKEQFNPVVRLVDFAHVKQLPEGEKDEGCIVGLRRIIQELEELQSKLYLCLLPNNLH